MATLARRAIKTYDNEIYSDCDTCLQETIQHTWAFNNRRCLPRIPKVCSINGNACAHSDRHITMKSVLIVMRVCERRYSTRGFLTIGDVYPGFPRPAVSIATLERTMIRTHNSEICSDCILTVLRVCERRYSTRGFLTIVHVLPGLPRPAVSMATLERTAIEDTQQPLWPRDKGSRDRGTTPLASLEGMSLLQW